jgi:glycosyltransferase involved in cell wall biosynthesis
VAIGGLEEALRELGHEVVVRAPRRRTGRSLSRLRFNLGLRGFRGRDFDLVVGFDLDGFLLPPLESATRVTALKGVMADELRFERGLTQARFRLLSRLERRNARAADRVIATSRYSRRAAVAAYDLDPGRVEVVPEGLDLSRWPDPGPRSRASGEAVILSVARQYRRKDTRTLLEALPAVLRKIPGVRLRILGGGPELPALRARARALDLDRSVTFLGEIGNRERVRTEYAAADLFALPSLQEGFGIAYLEAMASGLPVVAARAAAAPEVVPEPTAGILVPPGDPPALADALTRLLLDPDVRARMGAAGRVHAEAFGWPSVARRFLEAAGFPEHAGGSLAVGPPEPAGL